jgi:excisionase family DNA binding protein
MSGQDELLTTREVADLLGMSMSWVLKHWQAGNLPGYKLGAGASSPIRFKRSEIEAWLDEHRQGPQTSKSTTPLRAV